MANRTTQKQFEQFKESFKRAQDALSLNEYSIVFKMGKIDSYGSIDVSSDSMWAIVTISDKYEDKDFDPIKIGVHEAIHLLLSEYEYYAYQRFCSAESLDISNERIVKRLENSCIIDNYVESIRKEVDK